MNKLLSIALFFCPILVSGQLATWNFDGQTTTATLDNSIASASAAVVGVNTPGFDNQSNQENNCTSGSSDYVWAVDGWSSSGTIQIGSYFQFSITAKTNATVNVTGISFNAGRRNEGPQDYAIRYSTGTTFPASSDITSGSGNNAISNSNCNLKTSTNIDITLLGGQSITFRIYFWDAPRNNREVYIDDVDISGSFLPVELTSFSGTPKDQAVQLNWRTATELNNEKFIIERSTNERTFEPIGEIRGSGTTAIEKEYDFLDEAPYPGINYYRLKQMDFDGAYEYHKVIAVDFSARTVPTDNLGLTIAPNPAQDLLRINWTKGAGNRAAVIQLFDITGRQISTHPTGDTAGTFELPLANLPGGIYILRIAQDGAAESIRFKKG